MQVLGLKIDKSQGMKGQKKGLFAYFLTHVFARTERKLERFCKIKDSDLSFGVYELVSFGVFELVSF